MRRKLSLLLGQVTLLPAALGFLIPQPRWQGVQPPAEQQLASSSFPALEVLPVEEPISNSRLAFLAGACAVAAVVCNVRRKQKASEGVAMSVWRQYPPTPEQLRMNDMQLGDNGRGVSYRSWVNLNRRARNPRGRNVKYHKQHQYLLESGVWWGGYVDKWHHWYPNRDTFNLYKGPESHPENPWFPAASPGWQAVRGWAPGPVASTVAPRAAGAFVGGSAPFVSSAKRAVQFTRGARQGLVMHAHKKAAACTKNQGHDQRPKHWGVKKKGLQGNAVKVGQMLVRQKGNNWYAGANVTRGKDFTLHATKDGIVQWRGTYKHREVFVVPWEFVQTKCTWVSMNTLAPKEYEPWMGTSKKGHLRLYMIALRKKWLESDVGKEYMAKKEEKRKKQQEIQARIRKHAWEKQQGKGEKVAAGDSESESER
jgi:large subunit ribosomal protein L27